MTGKFPRRFLTQLKFFEVFRNSPTFLKITLPDLLLRQLVVCVHFLFIAMESALAYVCWSGCRVFDLGISDLASSACRL